MNEHQNRMCINETIYQEEKNELIMCVSGIISLSSLCSLWHQFYCIYLWLPFTIALKNQFVICSLIYTRLVIQTLFLLEVLEFLNVIKTSMVNKVIIWIEICNGQIKNRNKLLYCIFSKDNDNNNRFNI